MAAPAAAHLDHGLRDHLDVLHRQLTPHAVVVEGLGAAVGDDVEAGEVAARRARGTGSGSGSRAHATAAARGWRPATVPVANTLVLTIPLWRSAPPRVGLGGSASPVGGRAPGVPAPRRPATTPSTAPGSARARPGAPLFDVCFVVVDVETTGGSPATAALTEIAAAKYQGGECMGEFQSLVDPGCGVPPLISLLTGITDDMVVGAPPVSSVLAVAARVRPRLGHRRATTSASTCRSSTPRSPPTATSPLANTAVDTLALARRLVRPDVPNCKLRTLATALRLEHLPSHRALDDVRATADLLAPAHRARHRLRRLRARRPRRPGREATAPARSRGGGWLEARARDVAAREPTTPRCRPTRHDVAHPPGYRAPSCSCPCCSWSWWRPGAESPPTVTAPRTLAPGHGGDGRDRRHRRAATRRHHDDGRDTDRRPARGRRPGRRARPRPGCVPTPVRGRAHQPQLRPGGGVAHRLRGDTSPHRTRHDVARLHGRDDVRGVPPTGHGQSGAGQSGADHGTTPPCTASGPPPLPPGTYRAVVDWDQPVALPAPRPASVTLRAGS